MHTYIYTYIHIYIYTFVFIFCWGGGGRGALWAPGRLGLKLAPGLKPLVVQKGLGFKAFGFRVTVFGLVAVCIRRLEPKKGQKSTSGLPRRPFTDN